MQQFSEAVSLYQSGRADEARLLCTRILQHYPDNVQVLTLHGTTCVLTGRREEAYGSLAKAVLLNPAHAPSHYLLGNLQREVQNLPQAIACYQRAVYLKPEFVDAWINLGLTHHESGSAQDAIGSYRRALAINPTNPLALYNLGNLLQQLEQYREAVTCYQRALATSPNDVNIIFNLANALRAAGYLSDALTMYERAHVIRPAHVPILINMAVVSRRLGRNQAALVALDAALVINPENSAALLTRGNVLFQMGDAAACLEEFRHAIRIDPANADAHFNLGNVLFQCKQYEAAHEAYRNAERINPDHSGILAGLIGTKMALWDGSDLDAIWNRLLQALTDDASGVIPMDIVMERFDELSLQRKCAERHAADILRKYRPTDVLPAALTKVGQRYRIGYLSPDFGNHPVGLSLVEVLERADRTNFEMIGISLKRHPDSEIHHRLMNACESFHEIGELDIEQGIALLRGLQLDLLVDLAGYTADHRAEYLAARVASVQVGYLGYPGTLGTAWLDYLIADHYVIPSDQTHHYAENIALLPDCFFPTDTSLDLLNTSISRAHEGLPEDAFVYCCFNSAKRISPEMLRLWLVVLNKVPNSILWLQQPNATAISNLQAMAYDQGVDSQRIVFARFVDSRLEHLARHRLADLYLDTFPYNSQSTARDALYAGLPVLTCSGHSYASRVAGSLLTALELPQLITNNFDQYQRKAIALGQAPCELLPLRAKLGHQVHQSVLFDSQRLAKNLESLYRSMIERARSALPPAPFELRDDRGLWREIDFIPAQTVLETP